MPRTGYSIGDRVKYTGRDYTGIIGTVAEIRIEGGLDIPEYQRLTVRELENEYRLELLEAPAMLWESLSLKQQYTNDAERGYYESA